MSVPTNRRMKRLNVAGCVFVIVCVSVIMLAPPFVFAFLHTKPEYRAAWSGVAPAFAAIIGVAVPLFVSASGEKTQPRTASDWLRFAAHLLDSATEARRAKKADARASARARAKARLLREQKIAVRAGVRVADDDPSTPNGEGDD